MTPAGERLLQDLSLVADVARRDERRRSLFAAMDCLGAEEILGADGYFRFTEPGCEGETPRVVAERDLITFGAAYRKALAVLNAAEVFDD